MKIVLQVGVKVDHGKLTDFSPFLCETDTTPDSKPAKGIYSKFASVYNL